MHFPDSLHTVLLFISSLDSVLRIVMLCLVLKSWLFVALASISDKPAKIFHTGKGSLSSSFRCQQHGPCATLVLRNHPVICSSTPTPIPTQTRAESPQAQGVWALLKPIPFLLHFQCPRLSRSLIRLFHTCLQPFMDLSLTFPSS